MWMMRRQRQVWNQRLSVPESILTVSYAVLQELAQRVNPLADTNYGIDLYQEADTSSCYLSVTSLLVIQFSCDCEV